MPFTINIRCLYCNQGKFTLNVFVCDAIKEYETGCPFCRSSGYLDDNHVPLSSDVILIGKEIPLSFSKKKAKYTCNVQWQSSYLRQAFEDAKVAVLSTRILHGNLSLELEQENTSIQFGLFYEGQFIHILTHVIKVTLLYIKVRKNTL